MVKSIFTMSAEERMKHQEKEAKRIDRIVAKKIRAAKRKLKRAIAGKLLKLVAFCAIAAGAGIVAAKGRKAALKDLGIFLKKAMSKIKPQEAAREEQSVEVQQADEAEPLQNADQAEAEGLQSAESAGQEQEAKDLQSIEAEQEIEG